MCVYNYVCKYWFEPGCPCSIIIHVNVLQHMYFMWICLLFAIFQQVSDSNVTLKLPLASCPLPNTVQNRYTIYKTLATCQPSYHYNLLQLHQPSRASTQQLLQVPYISTDFGRRAFSYSSPATWNSITSSIKNCSSIYI